MPNGTPQIDSPIAVGIALLLFASVFVSIGIGLARKQRKNKYTNTSFNEDKPIY